MIPGDIKFKQISRRNPKFSTLIEIWVLRSFTKMGRTNITIQRMNQSWPINHFHNNERRSSITLQGNIPMDIHSMEYSFHFLICINNLNIKWLRWIHLICLIQCNKRHAISDKTCFFKQTVLFIYLVTYYLNISFYFLIIFINF